MNRPTSGTPCAPWRNCSSSRTTQEQFLASPLEQSYVFYRLVILGEAMSRLAAPFQEKYPELPWSAVISLRNRLVHSYFDLDVPLVWQIATTQVDEIARRLRTILETEFPGEPGKELES